MSEPTIKDLTDLARRWAWLQGQGDIAAGINRTADRIDELEASNAALREALEGLFYIEWTKRQIRDHSRQRDAARATLAEGEKP